MTLTFNPLDGWVFLLFLFLSIAIPWYFKGLIKPEFLVPWAYFLLSASFPAANPKHEFEFTSVKYVINDIRYETLLNWTMLAIMPVLIFNWRNHVIRFATVMFYFFCFDGIFMLWDLGETGQDFGLINGNTFDLAIAALFLPLWGLKGLIFIPLMVYYHAKTALVLVTIQLIWWLYQRSRITSFFTLLGAISTAGFLIYRDKSILLLSGRVEMWDRYIQWGVEKINPFYGLGLGSFEPIAKRLPVKKVGDAFRTFDVAHNDYLQITWDAGILGLLFFLLVIIATYKRLRNEYRLVAMCFIVMMLVYHPMHAIPSQILALFLLMRANE